MEGLHSTTDSEVDLVAAAKKARQAAAQPSPQTAAPVRPGVAPSAPASSKPALAAADSDSDGEFDLIAAARKSSAAAAAAAKPSTAPSSRAHSRAPSNMPPQELAAVGVPGERSPPAAGPLPAAVAVPLASLAELSGMVSGVVGDMAASLRSDIGRLEQGWQERWAAQQASTADLRQRLDGLQAAGASQAQEVAGRLQGMASELAAQRSRLDAVERAQQAPPPQQQQGSAAASPAKGMAASAASEIGQAAVPPAAASPSAPAVGGAASSPRGATVDDIMRRLSLLESRVGTQLQQIEEACLPASPRSAPISPLKSGPWPAGPFASAASPQCRSPSRRADSRAAQAAAVAAALVYGCEGMYGSPSQGMDSSLHGSEESEAAQLGWGACTSFEAALPGSPRIQASGMARPASAAAACYGGGGGQGGGRRSPGAGSGPASKRSRAVELQVAETHAIIAGIQQQIAAIKGSLAHAGGELEARRQEAGATALRLDQLARTDRRMVKVEAANLAGACSLERRVRGLEETVASAARQAAAGGVLARETSAALKALEWRVDQSADATIGTFKALEARVDKHRSELGAVAATATLADAKAASLAAEVARLQRRVHGGSPLGGSGSKAAATYRVY
ncbi:hypothetical protein ABPG75_003069 [Micractinium tetrahymenae]